MGCIKLVHSGNESGHGKKASVARLLEQSGMRVEKERIAIEIAVGGMKIHRDGGFESHRGALYGQRAAARNYRGSTAAL
jgi:hypothetical protein